MSYPDPVINAAYERNRRANNPAARAKKAASTAAWYQRNKDYADLKSKEWRIKEREKLILEFGGKCAHCGYDNILALDFDHINDDGYLEKGKTSKRPNVIYSVKKNRNRFQVLCKNCNWIKELNRRKNAKC